MKRILLIMICLGLVACTVRHKVGVSPRDIAEAEQLCTSHGGIDTLQNQALTEGVIAFDVTCIDGAEISYQKAAPR